MRDRCARIARLVDRGREVFDQDEAVSDAMERSLEILGEAANAVSAETQALYPSIDWRRIVKLRILLAHHYHRIESDQIWTIAVEDVRLLAVTLGPLAEDGGGGSPEPS